MSAAADGSVKPAEAAALRDSRHASARWKNHLAARRAGEELTKCNEVGVGLLVEPAAAGDEFVTEISDMGDPPAETTHAEP